MDLRFDAAVRSRLALGRRLWKRANLQRAGGNTSAEIKGGLFDQVIHHRTDSNREDEVDEHHDREMER